MNKQEFLDALRQRLNGLPQDVIDSSIDYYSEMIADYEDDGWFEEDAVAAIGSVDEIADQILADTPLPVLVKEKVKPARRLRPWEIILIIVGAPVWLPIAVAIASVALSVYIVLWCIVLVMYCVDLSFASCSIAGIFAAISCLPEQNYAAAAVWFGFALVNIGLAIMLFIGSTQTAKGICLLGKKLLLGIKRCFVRKDDSE